MATVRVSIMDQIALPALPSNGSAAAAAAIIQPTSPAMDDVEPTDHHVQHVTDVSPRATKRVQTIDQQERGLMDQVALYIANNTSETVNCLLMALPVSQMRKMALALLSGNIIEDYIEQSTIKMLNAIKKTQYFDWEDGADIRRALAGVEVVHVDGTLNRNAVNQALHAANIDPSRCFKSGAVKWALQGKTDEAAMEATWNISDYEMTDCLQLLDVPYIVLALRALNDEYQMFMFNEMQCMMQQKQANEHMMQSALLQRERQCLINAFEVAMRAYFTLVSGPISTMEHVISVFADVKALVMDVFQKKLTFSAECTSHDMARAIEAWARSERDTTVDLVGQDRRELLHKKFKHVLESFALWNKATAIVCCTILCLWSRHAKLLSGPLVPGFAGMSLARMLDVHINDVCDVLRACECAANTADNAVAAKALVSCCIRSLAQLVTQDNHRMLPDGVGFRPILELVSKFPQALDMNHITILERIARHTAHEQHRYLVLNVVRIIEMAPAAIKTAAAELIKVIGS